MKDELLAGPPLFVVGIVEYLAIVYFKGQISSNPSSAYGFTVILYIVMGLFAAVGFAFIGKGMMMKKPAAVETIPDIDIESPEEMKMFRSIFGDLIRLEVIRHSGKEIHPTLDLTGARPILKLSEVTGIKQDVRLVSIERGVG